MSILSYYTLSRDHYSKIIIVFCWLLAAGMAVFQFWHFAAFTVDDAYISYRYAENFANGQGLVFNRGEYVEGYTNFLWVMVLGLFKKLRVDVQHTSLVLGILCSSVTVWLTFLISNQISARHTGPVRPEWLASVFKTAAMLFVATSPAFGLWAVAGLETPLFLCLLTSAVWCSLREERDEKFPISAVMFGLLALTRPEGVLYFGLTLIARLLYCLRDGRLKPFAMWKHLLVFLAFVVPHGWWRWQYYGSLLPNTFYAKMGGKFYLAGVKYVYEFFDAYGGAALFLICGLLLLVNRKREYWVGYFLILLSVSSVYFMSVKGDWMPGFRFFVPLLPLFFLCIQEGIRELWVGLRAKTYGGLVSLGIGLIGLAVLGNNLFLLYHASRLDSRFDGHVIIGKFLKDHAAPEDVLAAIDIGALAYFSGLRTIDYFGLTDGHIARLTPQPYTFDPGFWGHRTFLLKADPEYILAQQPRFIELNTVNAPDALEQTVPADPYSALMLRTEAFRRAYIPFYHVSGTTIFTRTDPP